MAVNSRRNSLKLKVVASRDQESKRKGVEPEIAVFYYELCKRFDFLNNVHVEL